MRAGFLRDARERIGKRLGAAAALAGENRVEPQRRIDRWRSSAR